MYNFNCDVYSQYDAGLARDIEQAINGEYSAIRCYAILADMAPTPEERDRILEIRQDEIRHFETFLNIYMTITGREATPKITEECADRYVNGLQTAIKDEQMTVDFYLEIADKAQNPYVKEQFARAAKDEQNHAVWFLYFFTKWCCER